MAEASAREALDAGAAPAAVRGGALRVGGYLAGALLSLVASMILFRTLGVQDAGRFVTVQSLALLAAGISDAGLTTIGVRECATREGTDRELVLRDVLGMRIVTTGIAVTGAVLFAALAGYDGVLVLGTVISGLAVFLVALQHAVGVALVAELRQGWVTAVDVVRQGIAAAVVAGLALAGAGLVLFWGAHVVGAAVGLLVITLVVRRDVPLVPAYDLARWRDLARDVVVYGLAAAVAVLYFRLAMVLMTLITDDTQVGYFAAAFRGVEVLIVIPGLMVGAVFPVLARAGRDDPARLGRALGRVLEVSLAAAAGVVILLGVGAPVILRVVAGPEFEPAADVLRIHAIGLAASFLGAGPAYALLALRRHRAILGANLAALVVCAALVPVLGAAHGAQGAAVATSIAEWLLVSVLAAAVLRAGIRPRVDPGLVARIAIAAGIGALPAALPGIGALARTILCAVAFAGALVALRAVPRELGALLAGRGR